MAGLCSVVAHVDNAGAERMIVQSSDPIVLVGGGGVEPRRDRAGLAGDLRPSLPRVSGRPRTVQ